MIWDHKINEKISKREFLKKIKNFKEEDIEITPHALFRLNQKQRKVYEAGILKDFILNKIPVEIGRQNNGSIAVLYFYKEEKIIKILLDLRLNKIYIVTFYILNRQQMKELKK